MDAAGCLLHFLQEPQWLRGKGMFLGQHIPCLIIKCSADVIENWTNGTACIVKWRPVFVIGCFDYYWVDYRYGLNFTKYAVLYNWFLSLLLNGMYSCIFLMNVLKKDNIGYINIMILTGTTVFPPGHVLHWNLLMINHLLVAFSSMLSVMLI